MTSRFAECRAPSLSVVCRGRVRLAVLNADWAVSVCGERFVVPAGFTTDGASIPRPFRWICGDPMERPRVFAALLHDWLYTGGTSRLGRLESDRVYFAMLRHFGVSETRAFVEFLAVRAFGWSHWGT